MMRWPRLRHVLSLCALSAIAMPAVAGDAVVNGTARCGMYPEAVYATIYGAWSDCRLREVGEKPLWRGLSGRDVRQRIRFTFTHGHFAYSRVIDFTERANGTGWVELSTVRDRDGETVIDERHRYRVSTVDVAKLDALGESAGAWRFETGSWDGDEMYMHCQMLDMERVNAEGYRYSSVNIGCNHPDRLMPLVDFLTGLAKLRPNPDRTQY